jgi:dephospho-CoA kinase
MFLVGLTGGIAAGKSTVAEYWRSLGADIVDADELAREVVEPGSFGLSELERSFGEEIIQEDGSLDRAKLAGLVFSSGDKRRLLESITHPLIRELAMKRISTSTSNIVIYVIPLLVESDSKIPFDFIVTVEAPRSEQIKRMIESRQMDEKQALERINSQATPASRANMADGILNSNQALPLLLEDARIIFQEMKKLAATKDSSDVS